MFVLVRMQFHNHVDTQPVKRFERAMRYIYTISNWECCKCARTRFHSANALVVLRICAPSREHWSPGSLRDLITTTMNLNRKLGSLLRTNVFREEAVVDHNKLYDY